MMKKYVIHAWKSHGSRVSRRWLNDFWPRVIGTSVIELPGFGAVKQSLWNKNHFGKKFVAPSPRNEKPPNVSGWLGCPITSSAKYLGPITILSFGEPASLGHVLLEHGRPSTVHPWRKEMPERVTIQPQPHVLRFQAMPTSMSRTTQDGTPTS